MIQPSRSVEPMRLFWTRPVLLLPGTATTSLIMSFPGLLSPKSNGHKEPSLLDGLLGLDEQTRKLRQKQQHQVFSKDENLSPIVIKAPNSPRKAMLRSPLRSEPSFEIRSSLEESPEKPVKSSPSQKSFVLSSVRQIESKQDSSNRSGSKESKTQHMAKASSPSPDDSPIQPKDFLSKVTENSSKFISSRGKVHDWDVRVINVTWSKNVRPHKHHIHFSLRSPPKMISFSKSSSILGEEKEEENKEWVFRFLCIGLVLWFIYERVGSPPHVPCSQSLQLLNPIWQEEPRLTRSMSTYVDS